MADTFVLKAEARKDSGTKSSAKLRDMGRMPAIVYGHGKEPLSISVNLHDFTEALHHGQRVFDLDCEGNKDKLLVKDLQYDYLGRTVIHADLVRVDLNETVTVSVPIELKGASKAAEEEGAIIDEHTTEIEVECMVTNIPESIEFSLRDVQVGDTVMAKDLKLPEGVKLISEPDILILACHVVSEAPTEEEAEEMEQAEPERIGEKPEEGEGEEESGEE